MSSRLTIYEIADKAGVSIATVSRAINPETRHKVDQATLDRVQSIIARLGYTPNLAARHLGGSSFKNIGVILPHFQGILFSDYYIKVLAGVADALLDSHYHFKMIMLKPFSSKYDHYNFKAAEGVDALIITHWPNFFSSARVLERLELPCIVINDTQPGIRARFASADNLEGGRLAAEYLYGKGHKRLALFKGLDWSSDSRLRVQGFKNYLSKNKLKAQVSVYPGDFHEHKAYEIAKKLFQKKSFPTAVFCCNDLMAFGVLKALNESRLRCPEDVSVLGYDDDARSQNTTPPLSTIHVPLYEMTKENTLRLLTFLKNKDEKYFYKNNSEFPVKIVERNSVSTIHPSKRKVLS